MIGVCQHHHLRDTEQSDTEIGRNREKQQRGKDACRYTAVKECVGIQTNREEQVGTVKNREVGRDRGKQGQMLLVTTEAHLYQRCSAFLNAVKPEIRMSDTGKNVHSIYQHGR